jgi:hypothetical protein
MPTLARVSSRADPNTPVHPTTTVTIHTARAGFGRWASVTVPFLSRTHHATERTCGTRDALKTGLRDRSTSNGSDLFERRKVQSHTVRDLARLMNVGASAPERIDLGVAPSLPCGEKCGMKPDCVDGRQIPHGLPANHDGHRERVVPFAWVWDERRLLAKVDTVRVDVDAPKEAGELRLMG